MPIIMRKTYIYTVRPGETVYSIAQRYRSSVQEILRINYLIPPVSDHGLIYPGNVLIVPDLSTAGRVSYIVNWGEVFNKIAFRFSTPLELLSGINSIANPNVINPNQQINVPAFIYEIELGDTLAGIANRFDLSLVNLIRANQGRPGFSVDVIWPGYQLVLPLPTTRNIVVWNPLPGTRVVNGQRITGQARAFEATILHQLRDMNGVIVSNERFTSADAGAPAYGNFYSSIPFDRFPTTSRGELWVYTRSANDGSIQDLIRTVVYF
ncbi:LysM peptidoglycan-binding domain-containing protein [Mesobacillus maritimus]|uniref:LysM peptidoglycan-binding domain-containing protein n=1 Tax=Mesobacillus maritimus TaxID=1643336 RepID=UPI00385157FD